MAVEVVPHTTHNKFASAFDVAVVVLLVAAGLAAMRWGERFGGEGGAASASESLVSSCRAIRRSRELLYLGLVRCCSCCCCPTVAPMLSRPVPRRRRRFASFYRLAPPIPCMRSLPPLRQVNSLYEAALYVFVFLWTPALERRSALGSPGGAPTMGHGLVFSIFMLSKMAGSQAFHLLSRHLSPAATLQLVFAGSALCLAAPLLTESYERTLLAFCGFEGLLGMYWPSIALLRCGALDDAQRASTMAVFRVLLNVLVITILPLAGGLPEAVAFSLGAALLLICYGCIGVVKIEEEAARKQGLGRRRGGDEHGAGSKGNGRDRLVGPAEDSSNDTEHARLNRAVELEPVHDGELSGGESDEKAPHSPASSLRDHHANGHNGHNGDDGRPSPAAEHAVRSTEGSMEMIARWITGHDRYSSRHGKYSPVDVPHESGSEGRDESPREVRSGGRRVVPS